VTYIHRIAERNCPINSWRASRPWCTAGARGQNGASLPLYTRSRDPKIGPTSIYQTVSEQEFSETHIQPVASLSDRTGAKHDLRFDRTGFFTHLATRLYGYAVRHSGPEENLRSHERPCRG
jgi:hypothetical protein